MPRTPSSGHVGGAPTSLARVLEVQGRRLIWVAARLGVDASTVSRWRSGERPIPEQRLKQLASVLGVAPEQLADPLPEARPARAREEQP